MPTTTLATPPPGGAPPLGAAAFGGIVSHGPLGREQHVLHGVPSARQKIYQFHPVQDKRVTLAAAHNLEGAKNVKCIDCHVGATVTDKMIIKAFCTRHGGVFCERSRNPPPHFLPSGRARVSRCHPTGGQNPEQENAFHNASHHTKMPIVCYECHTVSRPA